MLVSFITGLGSALKGVSEGLEKWGGGPHAGLTSHGEGYILYINWF